MKKNKKLFLSGIATVFIFFTFNILVFPVTTFSQTILNNEEQSNEVTLSNEDFSSKDITNNLNVAIKMKIHINDVISENNQSTNEVFNQMKMDGINQSATISSLTFAKESIYSEITYGKIGTLNAENANIAISIADPFVNIRKKPNTDSAILGKLYKGAAAAIISSKGDWVLIESGTVNGYVKSEFLKMNLSNEKIIEKYGLLRVVVKADGLNVRKKADKESENLTVIYLNEVCSVLDVMKEWIKITVEDDNITGYVAKEYVDLMVNYNQAISIKEEQALLRLQKEKKAAEKATLEHTDADKPTVAINNNNNLSYTAEELKLLACLVHSESGNQPYEGKLAVANVVLNRIESSSYPNSMQSVIYQSGQFSVVTSGSLKKQLANYNNYNTVSQKLSIDAAKSALEGTNNIGSYLYFNRYSSSREQSLSDCLRIEDHLFW